MRSIDDAAILDEDLDTARNATPDKCHVVLRRVPAATLSFDCLVREEQIPGHRLVPGGTISGRHQLGLFRKPKQIPENGQAADFAGSGLLLP